jgi:hypothetical protein
LAVDAVHDTVDDASPRAAVTPVGAVGTPAGVAALEIAEATELPAADLAITVTVYAVPLVSPVMGQVNAVVVEQVPLPGVAVTVYPVTAEPLATAAVHDAVMLVSPLTSTTLVGAFGIALMVTAGDAADAADVPTAFVAVTVNV